ncbi:MAG: EAL domain-containing protein, partial [Caulobacteraceae bacterium]
QSGDISMVTRRVLDLLAEDAPPILRVLPCFHFAVNFSAADMHRADIVDEVTGFLTRTGVPHENLVIEATERSLVNVNLAKQTMGRLRSTGVKVAIDDFGTGYSSLSYLAQLDLDYLKIDKLFVHALGTGSATSHVAGRIIEMARDLNLQLIAEGIETSDQAHQLSALEVRYAQGYFYGRPMPLDDLLERLRAERSAGPLARGDAAA